MKIIIFLLLNSLTLAATCQVPVSELNAGEKKFFQTLITAAEYLKTHKTIPLAFHESETYSNEEAFYDTVIANFFSKEKMLKIFEKDTSHLAIAGKLDWMRHLLNETDYYLDIIPSDSIFVRPYNSKKLPNTLEFYLIVNNKDVAMYLWHFDSLNALLVGVSISAIPENEVFMSYLRRQKNYYEFPDPKRGVTINQ